MAQFNADILLNVSTNQRSLDRVAATVGRINSLAKQVKPINLFAPGAGAGADQVRTSMEAILKRAQAINKIGSAQISATYAGAAQTADAFAEVLRNVNIQAKNGNVALEQQDNRVQNLAGAYAQAAAKADLLSDRYAEIIRQARQAQGLAIGPVSVLGTVESDSAAAESRAQAVAQQQASKNLRSDVLYQRLRLQLLQKQSSELLKQDSIIAKLAQKAAKLGGAGKLGESLSLGVGFPLLFGAGPGSILGSAAGSFFGQGFGGQILGGGIGQVLDQAVIRVRDIGNAINQLSFDKLRESGVKVTRQLEEQLTFLKQIGRAEEARLQLSERVAQQTGTFAGTTEDIANATNILGDAWSKLTLSASTTLGIIGAPFVAALGAVLEIVNKIFQGLNFIGSAIGTAIKKAGEFVVELFGGEDALTGIENKLNNIDDQLVGLTQKAANLINTLSTKLSTTEIDLGVAQGLRLGDTADDKTANVRLKEQADLDKLRLSYINEQRELALQLDELGKAGYNKSLQLLKNDYERNKQLIKQKATNESIKISNEENERLTRLSAQASEKQAREIARSYKEGERIGNQLEVELSKLGGLTELQTELKVIAVEKAQLQERINALLDVEQRTILTTMNLERERLQIRQAEAAAALRVMNEREKDLKPLEDIQNERKALELRAKYGQVEAELRTRARDLAKDNKELTEQTILAELRKNEVIRRGVEMQEYQRQVLEQTIAGVGQQMAGLFETLITGTDDWNRTLTNALNSMASLLFQAGLSALGGGDKRGFFSILSGDFGGGRAAGGPVTGGTPYIVGEKGPELFVPGRSGGIVPNDQLGGGGVNSVVNVNISDSGVQTDASQGAALGREINSAVTAILIRERRPGGLLAR